MVERLIILALLLTAFLIFAQSASFLPTPINVILKGVAVDHVSNDQPPKAQPDDHRANTTPAAAQYNLTTVDLPNTTTQPSTTTTSTIPTTSTTQDFNADSDELTPNPTPSNDQPPPIKMQTPDKSQDPSDKVANNKSKPVGESNNFSFINRSANYETTIFFFSIFIVYVSFGKLMYHNVGVIKRNMTEPG